MGASRLIRCERTMKTIIVAIMTVATVVTVPDHWDRDEHRIIIALSFYFDDLRGGLIDDDLWFLWRFLAFLFFCRRGRRKYGSRYLLDHGFRSVS